MKYLNERIILCTMVIYFAGNDVAAVQKSHLGYLYEKPENILEETRTQLKNLEEVIEEEIIEKAMEEEEKIAVIEEEQKLAEREAEEKIAEREEEKENLEHEHDHDHLHHHLQPPKEYIEPKQKRK